MASYDNIAPHLADVYLAGVQPIGQKYDESVTGYTTRSFMRLKLKEKLSARSLAHTSTNAAKKASTG